MRIQHALGCLIGAVLLPGLLIAADAPASKSTTKPVKGLNMDYGPFISYSLLKPRPPLKTGVKASVEKHKNGDPTPLWKAGELIATKGINVKLGDSAAICFDADTCRYAAGWIGGFVDVSLSNLTRKPGTVAVDCEGRIGIHHAGSAELVLAERGKTGRESV